MTATHEPGAARDAAIPSTMKAVVAYAPQDYRLEQLPVPALSPDDVLVRVEACGVCGSDVKTFKGAQSLWGGDGNPAYIQPPVVPGHELLGHVAAIGERAAARRGLRVGDRVIAVCGGDRGSWPAGAGHGGCRAPQESWLTGRARPIGADVGLNPGSQDVVARVLGMTDGYGCDVFIETVGHPSAVGQGDRKEVGDRKELDVYGGHLGPYTYPRAIEFLSNGAIDMRGVVTDVLPLHRFDEAINKVAAARGSVKVVLKP